MDIIYLARVGVTDLDIIRERSRNEYRPFEHVTALGETTHIKAVGVHYHRDWEPLARFDHLTTEGRHHMRLLAQYVTRDAKLRRVQKIAILASPHTASQESLQELVTNCGLQQIMTTTTPRIMHHFPDEFTRQVDGYSRFSGQNLSHALSCAITLANDAVRSKGAILVVGHQWQNLAYLGGDYDMDPGGLYILTPDHKMVSYTTPADHERLLHRPSMPRPISDETR